MEGSWVQQTVYNIFLFAIRQLTGELSNSVWEWFDRFFSAPLAVLDDPLVHSLVRVGIGIALGVMPVLVGWMALKDTLSRLDGTSMTPPEALIRRSIITGMAVTGTSVAAWFMVSLTELTREVVAAFGLDIDLIRQFFVSPLEPVVTVLFLSLAFCIGAVILTIQRAVITAEFTVLLIMGPLMALGLMKEDSKSTWGIWLKEITSLLITPLIQMVLLLVFIRKWADAAGVLSMGDRLASLAFLYVMFRTPGWARQMVYSAGVGGGMTATASGVARIAVMKMLFRGLLRG